MSSAELTVLQQPELVKTGGLGINFKSAFFNLKPATININQPTTQAEGAIKGKLRLTPSGSQSDFLRVALLATPTEQRQYYIGEKGQNRTPDNLMCFCRDVQRAQNKARTELQGPDGKARVPQSMLCRSCPKADWEPWRQNKVQELIPPCDSFFHASFINVDTKLPMQMYIRSKSKQPFEKGMDAVTQILYEMDAQGITPNIFDVTFRLGTKGVQNGKTTTYILDMSDFRVVTPEEKISFAAVFAKYGDVEQDDFEPTDEQKVEKTTETIGNTVAGVVDDIQDAEIIV